MDENVAPQQIPQTPPPMVSQSLPKKTSSSGFPKILLSFVVLLVVLGFITGAYYLGTQKSLQTSPTKTANSAIVTPSITPTSANSENWKIYSSQTEKVTFQYPPDWTMTKSSQETTIPSADTASFKSPDGDVAVNWVSALSGFGGACSATIPLGPSATENPCPSITILSVAAIKNAPGLSVVGGYITTDGKTFRPFLAVQDAKGLLVSQRSIGYDMFAGKNNGGNDVLFSTTDANLSTGPSLTQQEATDWFIKPNVQKAKQILMSLSY